MRNITDNALAKARKKWQMMQKSLQYRIGEIVIHNRTSGGSDYEKIKEIASLLKTGDGVFSEIAYQSSDSKSSEKGGDCGWNMLENFDRPIQDFLRTASIGDISPIMALPTAGHPEKWVLVLYMDQRNPESGPVDKDPGDDFFRNQLFSIELERLAKIEMEELKKSYPSTLHIPKHMKMPSEFSPSGSATNEEDIGKMSQEKTLESKTSSLGSGENV